MARVAPRAAVGAGKSCIDIGPGAAVNRPLKTSELVARGVVHDIIERGLQPGDGLPAETAMLEHYGVSRESLREGLRLLEVQGLISIRRGPGGGPVVGTVDPANLGRMSALYYHLAGATYRELFEAWVLSEAMIAELAAANPDARAREAAMAPYLLKGSAPHSQAELDEFMVPHLEFHAAIARLANNKVLEIMLRTSGQIVSHHMAVEDDPRGLADMLERDHVALARVIAAGQPAKARRMMEEHIRNVVTVNLQNLGDKVDEFIEWR